MIRKIISIRNMGRFKNSAAAGNPDLGRHTLIVGANGFGKTTLCAMLRSLKTGDAAHITGRKTLGVEGPPTVELLLATGPARFNGEAWSSPYSALAIFDGVFVAENVHSGEVVEIDHRRNLYRVMIGENGIRLAEEDTRLAAQSREKTGEITGAARAIQPHIPPGMNLGQFIALTADPDIDARIAEQERTTEAVRQAKRINERPALSQIEIPSLTEDFRDLLAKSIDDIAQDAEALLAEHLAAHGMDSDGGNWIAKGLDHADSGTCPFCGQDISDLSLISAYKTVFSARYKALQDEIKAMRSQVAEQFGDEAIGRVNTRVERNKGTAEFWNQYCSFNPALLEFPAEISQALRTLGRAAIVLLERKDRTPLEEIPLDETFTTAATAYETAQAMAKRVADAIQEANTLIATKKKESGAAEVQTAEAELVRRKAVKIRHTDPVTGLCAEYSRLTAEKQNIDDRKIEIRAQLDEHTVNVIRPYERRINEYLDAFNAGFTITETRHAYPGGTAASSYQLVINNTAIDIGDGRTPPNRPSFKNTLSAGDRTTLALAFFLAYLERDQALADKTVVFDDPFSSQDAFRRRQTVHEIAKVAQNCAQVIVLSHDATFLKQVWDKAPAAERVALTLADHRAQGSKIVPIDLERACLGRTANDIDDLQSFLTSGAGILVDVVRKMRGVLETHCWTTYPAYFRADQDWLGDIVRKIREGADQHPARDLYDELDQINAYTRQYYHGEDLVDATPNLIDPNELTGYVRRTLRVVNALQA
jgi:wobble nucleotide-excising tRNase